MSQRRVTFPVEVAWLHSESSDTEIVSETIESGDWALQRRYVRRKFVEPEYPRNYGPFNPWELRKEFLKWEPADFPAFIVKTGRFGTNSLTELEFMTWQSLIRAALEQPASKWRAKLDSFESDMLERLRTPVKLTINWDAEVPEMTFEGLSTIDAIIATVQIDKLENAEFRLCARNDCNEPPFKIGSHRKIFCSSECAHLTAVRESRKRARTKSRKAAPGAAKKKKQDSRGKNGIEKAR